MVSVPLPIEPAPVLAPAVALAGVRPKVTGRFLLQRTAKRVPALLVACKAAEVAAAVCVPKSTSEVALAA